MRNRPQSVAWPIIVLSLLAVRAHAHHSFGAFDTETEIVLSGEILRFEWTNPHTRTWLRVMSDEGAAVVWELEGMSPDYLGRRGWTRTTLEPGDIAKITIHPLRSGAPGGTFLRGTLADGRRVVMFAR